MNIEIYTDGSCNPKHQIGAWAAVINYDNSSKTLSGIETETTHNRMELLAFIKSIEYLLVSNLQIDEVTVFTDSQYLLRINDRKSRLTENNFITKSGKEIQNTDLLLQVITLYEKLNIKIIKVKAHSNIDKENNLNRKVDILARKLVRNEVEKITGKYN